jgi:tetratricopeptide (TPR) repeat protein
MRRCFGVVTAALVLVTALRTGAEPPAPAQGDSGVALAHSLAETEQHLGRSAPELLPILASLAQLRFEHAEFAEALALRRRSLKIAIAAYGSAAVPAADAMAALAHLYIEQRRYLDAEPLVIAATNVLRDRLGPTDPALAPVLADQARIALARGNDHQARKWAEEAVAIDAKNHQAPQSDHLRVLGAVLVVQGKFDDGERILRQALALDRAKANALATARSLAQLANAYLRRKRFAEALPPIEEATRIDQNRLGPTHPLIAEDFHDLGLIYLGVNRADDAARALRMAIGLLETGAGRGTPTLAYVQLDLARAEHVLGHDDQAQSLFKDARRILNAAEDEERDRQRRA